MTSPDLKVGDSAITLVNWTWQRMAHNRRSQVQILPPLCESKKEGEP